jgi:PAS domain-containing protein
VTTQLQSPAAMASTGLVEQFGDWAKTLAALGGLIAGVVAVCSRLWRRRKAQRELRALEAKAIRYLLDAQRHTLYVISPGPDRFLQLDEIDRQRTLIDQVRDEMWIADGHGEVREAQRRAEEIARVLTRTQAIQAKRAAQEEAKSAGQPTMFKEHAQ